MEKYKKKKKLEASSHKKKIKSQFQYKKKCVEYFWAFKFFPGKFSWKFAFFSIELKHLENYLHKKFILSQIKRKVDDGRKR